MNGKSNRKMGIRWTMLLVMFVCSSLLASAFLTEPLFGAIDDQNKNLILKCESVRVLFDETRFPVQGVNGSIHTQEPTGYIELAELLVNNSFLIDTLDYGETINESDLADCDILVMAAPFNNYLPEEIERLYTWVITGGSFFLITELGPLFTQSTSIIAERFGYEMANDVLLDSDANRPNEAWPIFEGANINSHEITTNVFRVETYGGDGILKSPLGSQALITSDNDDTTYWRESLKQANNIPILSINEKWNGTDGKIAILADSNIFDNRFDADQDGDISLMDSDNEILALNLFKWLGNIPIEKVPLKSIYISFITILGLMVYLAKRRKK